MSHFEEAFELTGHGVFNYLALFTNGFTLLYVTIECLGLGYVLDKADCDLDITVSERGVISAATFIGVVTPAIFWGYLSDRYGRRKVMLPATVLAVVFSLFSSLSVNYLSMCLCRIITGTLISASCATAYVYLGELTSPSQRAASIAWGSTFIAGAYFMMPLFALILLPRQFSIPVTGRLTIVSWRVLMWAFTIWGTAACIGMAILPESPSFLLSSKGGPTALAVLAKIYAWNSKKPAEEFPVKEIDSPAHPLLSFRESIGKMKYLLKPPLLRCIILSHVCNFMVFLQSNAFYVWMPHMVDEMLKHMESKPKTPMCKLMNEIHANIVMVLHTQECVPTLMDIRVYPIAMIVGILTAIIYMCIGIGIKRWGKQIVYCVTMCVCATLILTSAFVPSLILAIALFIPGLCGIAANTVLAAAIVEVVPTSLRALAMCTLFMVGRLGAASGAHLLAWALQHNCAAVVVTVTLMTAASGILLYTWPDSAKVRAKLEAENFTY